MDVANAYPGVWGANSRTPPPNGVPALAASLTAIDWMKVRRGEYSPCASILDVGCGEGWLARTLSSEGYNVTGVDASASLIDEAAKAEI